MVKLGGHCIVKESFTNKQKLYLYAQTNWVILVSNLISTSHDQNSATASECDAARFHAHRDDGTVIAIIAVLASLTFGGMSYYGEKMKYSRTEVLIASIERALEDYKSDNGSYPSGNIGDLFNALYGDGTNVYLATLNPELKGKQRNVSESEPYLIVDAWGKVLRYRHNKNNMANPKQDYDLISLGPNGVGDFGSTTEWAKADDIKNW